MTKYLKSIFSKLIFILILLSSIKNSFAYDCPKPIYPSQSIKNNEQGTVTLRILVKQDGTVFESEIKNSSGHTRLDEATRVASLKCKFDINQIQGKLENGWITTKYTWRIQ
jgi:TonB family protein